MLIHKNKKAYFNYEIKESFEAGISLTGAEVKSVRNGQINLKDAFVRIDDSLEAWLWNADITKYRFDSNEKYENTRTRKLLLKKKEILGIKQKMKEAGFAVAPLKVYMQRNRIKIEIALVRGKKQHEKRAKVKEREQKRELHAEKRKYMIQ